MNENTIPKKEELEIDLGRIFRAVLDRAWLIAAVTILCTVLTLAVTVFFVTPQYEAAAKFYVNNSSQSAGNASSSISSGDLSTSRNLVDSYIVILNTRETLDEILACSGVNRSIREISEMISAKAVNDTEIIQVTVTGPDPEEAVQIANAVAQILPERISTIIDGTSAKLVEAAVKPGSPSSPSYVKNTVIGFLLGFFMSVAVIALREIFDITIRSDEDIAQVCKYPILASVPDMAAPAKGGSHYGFASKLSEKNGAHASGKQPARQNAFLGSGISFAASEAYKLLRTKLLFSFSDESNSRVIGVSSALSGEGKSLSSVNLAYSLTQLNKKVVLIDCDMRRPTLAEKLRIRKGPGLSSFLTGQSYLGDVLQSYSFPNEPEHTMYVISAGQNPPNPIELLSSVRMKKMLDVLRDKFDYVIIDLPPAGEVSDALALAEQTDGILLVVRQNHCDRVVLADAVRQFEFIRGRILGVVFNGTSEREGKYGSYADTYERSSGSKAKSAKRKASR